MYPFRFQRPLSETETYTALTSSPTARAIAGGTTLVDLMRDTVERPDLVVDINPLPWRAVETTGRGLRIGALARMSDVAATPGLAASHRVLVEALLASAAPQIRNMASIGGNLMQRTRCPYFRDPAVSQCNKKTHNAGCAAIGGYNREHAIFGTSDQCVATHPSDLAVALLALDAQLVLRSRNGERRSMLEEFMLLPGGTPMREHDIIPGELIAAVEIPANALGRQSRYIKIRDRGSFEFALVSAAVALDMRGGTVHGARIAVGGVGTKPWRLRQVESALVGFPINEDRLNLAMNHVAIGAKPLAENGFKVELLKRTLKRTIHEAGAIA
ncbi:MAG TPA: xanthine dehydrogenase family protein subunit M [Stellaceae bacterium]|nr:xanthine dehydrogenase family protein subunit M [Stellaceae bacterium]